MLTLSEKIGKIIQESGLSLAQFAQKTGVSKNTLVNYRDGVTSPSGQFIIKICKEFSVNPRWIILEEGEVYRAEYEDLFQALQIDKIMDIDPGLTEFHCINILLFEAMKKTGIILTSDGIEKMKKFIYEEAWSEFKGIVADVLTSLVRAAPNWEAKKRDHLKKTD
ncbi:MAG TPA: helix-turn-helix transcriptional regulator [Desulfatiglandales bacterium]|nr:helix-turn-helix transcriptional regulator [Desulfatiglandales bacterium]